jgi:hypothetical protein
LKILECLLKKLFFRSGLRSSPRLAAKLLNVLLKIWVRRLRLENIETLIRDVRPLGVRALESWDSIKRLLEELSNLFVEARYFHD